MNAMITYKFKAQTTKEYVSFIGEKIEYKNLRKDISTKTGTKQEELILYDQQTNTRLKDGDYIKAFSSIIVERSNPLLFMPTIQVEHQKIQNNSPQEKASSENNNSQLDSILNNAKYFMIKSSNQINIQKAKQQSIWATTMINQRKLKMAYEQAPHVILFFKASNSNNLYGVARMEESPSDIANKSVWIGVETIKLGGNFKIRWLSKSILASSKYQNQINPLTKQYVSRSADMTQIEKELGKKMVNLFEIPKEQQISLITPVTEQKIFDINQILQGPSTSRPSTSLYPSNTMVHPFNLPRIGYPSYPVYPPIANSSQLYMNHKKQSQKKTKKSRRSQSESSSSSPSRQRSRKKDKKKKRQDSRDKKKSKSEKYRDHSKKSKHRR